MKTLGIKINILLIGIIVLLIAIVLFIDNESLNSLFINYDNNLVINEVSILDVDYNKVIYNNTSNNTNNNASNSGDVNTNSSNASPTLVNKVTSNNSWVWPTDRNYVITTYYNNSHKALDIHAGYGSNIYAVNNGVVTMVKGGCVVGNLSCNGRGGNYIVIKHNSNNYYTVYMHLKDIKVSVGTVVTQGQVIGTMGNTGNVIPVPTASNPYAGTHLHFCLYIGEPYKGGYAVNPMRLY